MNEDTDLPNLPGYVSIKEAGEMLDLASSTVYKYNEEGRIPAVRAGHVILIAIEDIKQFKRKTSGRPRSTIPIWRISPEDNTVFMTLIRVRVREGQHRALMQKWEEIKRSGEHLFPGTIARYIGGSDPPGNSIDIVLIWRSSVLLPEAEREQQFASFRQALADVLDWSTARYTHDKVYMHT